MFIIILEDHSVLVELTSNELIRYADTILIKEIGIEGQRILKSSSVLVIGAGGLGSPVMYYLCASGVGRIGIMDSDVVNLSNLQRQIIYGTDQLGLLKTESAKQKLSQLNPLIKLETYPETLSQENGEKIIPKYDVVIGSTDNYESYALINKLCVQFEKPYVFGAVSQFEGQVGVFWSPESACYECVFAKNKYIESKSYPFSGIFSPLPGVIGSLQACEALKLLLGIGDKLISKLLICNVFEGKFFNILLDKNPLCPVCGK